MLFKALSRASPSRRLVGLEDYSCGDSSRFEQDSLFVPKYGNQQHACNDKKKTSMKRILKVN